MHAPCSPTSTSTMPRLRKYFLAALLTWVAAYSGPELFQDRIFPYDGALHASTGAFFLTVFKELPSAARAPRDWAYDYYEQYPALAVRRHPLVFGVTEAVVYSLTGVSVFGANLTVFLFTLGFAIALYFACLRFWKDELVAFGVPLLFLTSPEVSTLTRSVWLDIPALAFAALTLYFYARRLDGDTDKWRYPLLLVLFTALSLYTYQLTFYLLAGVYLHLLVRERHTFWRDKKLLVSGGLFLLIMVPLVLQTVLLASDNLANASGVVLQKWEACVTVPDRYSFAFWSRYAAYMWNYFPVQSVGLVVWLLLLPLRRPTSAEWMFLLSFLVGYIGFSWNPYETPRYAVHFSLATTALTVLAFRDLGRLALARLVPAPGWVFAGGLTCAALVQAFAIDSRPFYLAGMDRPVQTVLGANPAARILYSGPCDAAFVFYVRQADGQRQARVYRTTVRPEEPKDLRPFLRGEKIDFIVFEDTAQEAEAQMPEHVRFREEIRALVADDPSVAHVGDFDLPYGRPGKESTIRVRVYSRLGSDTHAGKE
ncbi:MAG TPA: glycosyltransferase family 39 protein [Gemmataceae bacterium]|nr:glycosyltransferase family 39 protein [Gemmataceae bacterium]